MAADKDDEIEISPAGIPILRHQVPESWQEPGGEDACEQITDHIERHIGKVETVFHEVASDTIHLDVLIVLPNERYPYIRLVTSGMSDLPMTTPAGSNVPKYAELCVSLPADWRIDTASYTTSSFQDENWYWPVRLLKTVARLPHKCQSWIGLGHTIGNGGDRPEPYAPATKLCAAMIFPVIDAPEDFQRLKITDDKVIRFFEIMPIYAEELSLKLSKGTDELLDAMDKHKLDKVIRNDRPNVALKKFRWF